MITLVITSPLNSIKKRRKRRFLSNVAKWCYFNLPQHCLYFWPEPHGHGSLRPTFGSLRAIT